MPSTPTYSPLATELVSGSDAVRTIVDTAREGVPPTELEVGKVYAARDNNGGIRTIDLTGEEYLAAPKAKTGQVTVWDSASFTAYYAKHGDDSSELWADVRALNVLAVLDANTADGARWGRHKVLLQLRRTPEWTAWEKRDGQMLKQEEFAEFLEDNLSSVVQASDGTGPTAAEMLQVAESLKATAKVEFESGVVLKSGARTLGYTETVAAKAGGKGTLEIPDVFTLGVVPFEGSEGYLIKARFRYRIEGTHLTLGYRLDRPEVLLEKAFGDVVTALGAVISEPILAGNPRL